MAEASGIRIIGYYRRKTRRKHNRGSGEEADVVVTPPDDPVLEWTSDGSTLLPTFNVSLTDPEIGDIVRLTRSRDAGFSTPETADDEIEELDSPFELAWDFGAEWPAEYWYVKAVVYRDGDILNESNTEVVDISGSAGVAPVLTDATDDATGLTTATLGFATDTSTGTAYTVVTTSDTDPDEDQVEAGEDHLGAPAAFDYSQPISAAGSKTVDATGLTQATQYYSYHMHKDVYGNRSAVLAGDGFKTYMPDTYITAANGGEQTLVASATSYAFADLTIGAADTRRRVVLAIASNAGTLCTHTALTANAGAVVFSQIAATGTTADSASTNHVSIWEANVTTGTTLTAPTLTTSAAPNRVTLVGWTHGRGAATDWIEMGAGSGTGLAANIDVAASGIVLGMASTTTIAEFDWTMNSVTTGITEHIDGLTDSSLRRSAITYTNGTIADVAYPLAVAYVEAGVSKTVNNPRLVAAAFGAQV